MDSTTHQTNKTMMASISGTILFYSLTYLYLHLFILANIHWKRPNIFNHLQAGRHFRVILSQGLFWYRALAKLCFFHEKSSTGKLSKRTYLGLFTSKSSGIFPLNSPRWGLGQGLLTDAQLLAAGGKNIDPGLGSSGGRGDGEIDGICDSTDCATCCSISLN